MAEPFSIAAAASSLAALGVTIAYKISRYVKKVKGAPEYLVSIQTQCALVSAILSQIQRVAIDEESALRSKFLEQPQLVDVVNLVLESVQTVFSVLEKDVAKLDGRLSIVWNMEDLNEKLDLILKQQLGINTLLQLLQSRTLEEMSKRLIQKLEPIEKSAQDTTDRASLLGTIVTRSLDFRDPDSVFRMLSTRHPPREDSDDEDSQIIREDRKAAAQNISENREATQSSFTELVAIADKSKAATQDSPRSTEVEYPDVAQEYRSGLYEQSHRDPTNYNYYFLSIEGYLSQIAIKKYTEETNHAQERYEAEKRSIKDKKELATKAFVRLATDAMNNDERDATWKELFRSNRGTAIQNLKDWGSIEASNDDDLISKCGREPAEWNALQEFMDISKSILKMQSEEEK